MFDRILVVCTGNICRSPVGAALLRRYFPDKRIECAGLNALENSEADPTARELAEADDLDLGDHRGCQLTDEMIQQAELILVMTNNQRRAIEEQSPASTGKIMLYGQWLPSRNTGDGGVEIPDPHRKSREAFIHVHQLLKQAAAEWKYRLR